MGEQLVRGFQNRALPGALTEASGANKSISAARWAGHLMWLVYLKTRNFSHPSQMSDHAWDRMFARRFPRHAARRP
jgi:hypothetical protein